jgi:hypothetical protein
MNASTQMHQNKESSDHPSKDSSSLHILTVFPTLTGNSRTSLANTDSEVQRTYAEVTSGNWKPEPLFDAYSEIRGSQNSDMGEEETYEEPWIYPKEWD